MKWYPCLCDLFLWSMLPSVCQEILLPLMSTNLESSGQSKSSTSVFSKDSEVSLSGKYKTHALPGPFLLKSRPSDGLKC